MNLIEIDLEETNQDIKKEEKSQGTTNIIDLLGNNIELTNNIPHEKQIIQSDCKLSRGKAKRSAKSSKSNSFSYWREIEW